MKRFFAAAAAVTALFAAGNLKAMDVVSQNMTVPFEFKVQKSTMPAGQYRIEREFGKQSVYIVNVNTGRRVYVIRDARWGTPNRAVLSFEETAQGYKLAKVF